MNRKKRVYPWQRWRRRVIIGCLVCFVVLPALLAGIAWRNQTALDREMAAIRAKGFPATPADLDKIYPEPPKAQNAAETYQQSFNQHKVDVSRAQYDDMMRQFNDIPEGGALAEALHRQMSEYLQANAEALRLLHEASGLSESRYPVDFSKGYHGVPLPHLAKLRQSVRLLQIEAIVAAEECDTRRALDAVSAAFAAGNSIREPIPVSQQVHIACRGVSLDAVKRMISIAAFSDGELAGLGEAVRAEQDPAALTRALAGERALALTSFEHPETIIDEVPAIGAQGPGTVSAVAGLMRIFGVTAGDRGRYLSYMDELIAASQKPPWEAIPLMDAVGSRLQSNERPMLMSFTLVLVPRLVHLVNTFARDAANTAAAETAVAIERYRLAHGNAVPERLEQLVPDFLAAVALDPFDGKPLRYRHDDRGYAVYSINEDMQDDGGEPPARNPKRPPRDVVFRVDHAPPAANLP